MADRDSVTQRFAIADRPSPFRALGLDRQPGPTSAGVVYSLEWLEGRVNGCQAALDGRVGSVEVPLPCR
jgi:hypothetical protein